MFCQFGGLASSPLPLYRPIGLISNGSCSIPTTYADFIFGRNYRRGSVVVAQIDRKQKYGGLLNQQNSTTGAHDTDYRKFGTKPENNLLQSQTIFAKRSTDADAAGISLIPSAVWTATQLQERKCVDTVLLAQRRFTGLAISNAKILIYFSNKIYRSSFIKQHSKTVMVCNYQNADCSLRKKLFCHLL